MIDLAEKPTVFKSWGGKEWQEYITPLLTLHHGATEFQQVPDKDRGDLGLEGFSSDRCVYQCFAAEEPVGTKELYEKQRDKITADIGKFVSQKERLSLLFGKLSIRRWILVVPRMSSKELLLHAAKKRDEVLAKCLPYVAPDFEILVITDQAFPLELATLTKVGAVQVDVPLVDISSIQVDAFAGVNSALVSTLQKKLSKLGQDTVELRTELIRRFLIEQNALERLRQHAPDIYDEILRKKLSRERLLALQHLSTVAPNPERLGQTLKTYREDLTCSIKGLDTSLSEALAWGAIADWLLRCPLDFPQ